VHFGLLSKALGGQDHRAAFAQFVARVSRGEPWESAFVAEFDATPEQLDEEFERHRQLLVEMKVGTVANISLDLDQPEAVFEPVEPLEMARELSSLAIEGGDWALDSAAQLLDSMLETQPDDPAAICSRIRVAARQRELDLADSLWDRLDESQRVGLGAREAQADLCLAHARKLDADEQPAVAEQRLSCAISGYGQILEQAPERLSALAGLGRALVLAEREDPTTGIAALERATELSPDDPRLRLDLAELLIRRGDTSAALGQLDHVLEAYAGTEFADRAKRLRRRAR